MSGDTPESGSEEYLIVGRLVAPFGVKGWVKVRSYTEPEHNLFSYRPWYIGSATDRRQLEVVATQSHGKGVIVRLKGCQQREDAAALAGQDVFVRRSQLAILEGGEHYWRDLLGLKVLVRGPEQAQGGSVNLLLGKVAEFIETGANDVLVIKPVPGSVDKRERLVPFLAPYVLDVDSEAGEILLDWELDF